jgi:polyisoprenoid-binding protein YceI
MNGRLNRQLTVTVLVLLQLSAVIPAQRSQSARPAKPAAKSPVRSYTIAVAQSEIIVLLTQEGLISRLHPNHRVAVGRFSGSIELPADDESKASVTVEAAAKSLTNVDKDMSDFERRGFQDVLHNSVLESERFPSITFRSVSVTDLRRIAENRTFTLNGDLTLRGVTRKVSIPVSLTLKNGQLRATGEAKFRQSDFKMKPYTGALGSIKIGDEVKVSFTIIATAS